MEKIVFLEPVSCVDCRRAFLKARLQKQRVVLIADRRRRQTCRGCSSLAVYERGEIV